MAKKFMVLSILFLLFSTSTSLSIFDGQAQADQDTLRPTADAGAIYWVVYPSGDDYTAIDEATPNEDTDYLYTIGTGDDNWQGWDHTDWSVGTIDSVMLTVRHKSIATVGSPEIIIGRRYYTGEFWTWCTNDAGTDTISLGSSYANDSITWNTDPLDGNAWTQDKLNAASQAWSFWSKTVGTKVDSFGLTSAASPQVFTINYWSAYKYTADYNGTVDSLLIQFGEADGAPFSNWKFGFYSDSGASPGYPYQRLDTTAAIATHDPGWHRIALVTGGVSVTDEDIYWIIFRVGVTANADTVFRNTVTNGGMYKAMVWTTQWPGTMPSGATRENKSFGLQAIGSYTAQNRVTQSFVTVFYAAAVTEGQVIIVH